MSDRFDDLVKNSIRAAEAKFGVRAPGHDEAADWIPPAVSIKPPPPGVSVNALAATQILIDLIAQLRDHCREPSCNCDIGRAADYAETRLRLSRDD